MFKIEYEIELNDAGRPCISLPRDYEQNQEDRFFVMEITRYILQDLLARRSVDVDSTTVREMDEAERFLGQLSDEVAEFIYESMRVQGEMQLEFDCTYHVRVSSVEERDALPDKDIIYEDKIYDRFVGLRVYVLQSSSLFDKEISGTYELVDGITNEHWVKI